jgi:hypothetical protein
VKSSPVFPQSCDSPLGAERTKRDAAREHRRPDPE